MIISIAICTYNGEKFLVNQLNSIFTQTRRPDEIVVCDDGSTDGTIDILQHIDVPSDIEFRIYINKHNLGFTKNFEKAISLCTGNIIFLSDQDDIWFSNKIESMLPYFDNPDVNLVHHNDVLVDEACNTILPSYWDMVSMRKDEFPLQDHRTLLQANCVQGSACAFRRKVFDDAAPFPEFSCHDEWLALIAASTGELYAIKEPLMYYRQWSKNTIGVKKENRIKKLFHVSQYKNRALKNYRFIERRKKVFEELLNRFQTLHSVVSNSHCQTDYLRMYQFMKNRMNYIRKARKKHLDRNDYRMFYPSKRAYLEYMKDTVCRRYYNSSWDE